MLSNIRQYIKKHIYVSYTILFLLLSLLIFYPFWSKGYTFVWKKDGWLQHYKALCYYGEWLRELAYNLFCRHRISIPEWSFSIGYGSDIITTLHYYAIGDPLNLAAVFVPVKYTYLLYDGLILLRLYLAGAAFVAYCRFMGNRRGSQLLAGAISYVFCGYALYASVRHPFFLNPMIYLPLMFLGMERWFRKKKPCLYVVAVFISAVSNFYFFYMIVMLTVLYAVIRLVGLYGKEIGNIFRQLVWLFCLAVIGVLMSAAVFLPVILRFLDGGRTGTGYTYEALYEKQYYRKFLSGFISYGKLGFWTILAYTVPALLAVLLLFLRRKNRELKIAFVLLTLCLGIPFVGYAMNGFSYVTNRYIWGYSFLVSYILVKEWEELCSLKGRKRTILVLAAVGYGLACVFFGEPLTEPLLWSLSIGMAALALMYSKIGREMGLLLIIFMQISIHAYYLYDSHGENYVSEFMKAGWITQKTECNQDAVIKEIQQTGEDNGFFRYSTPYTKEKNTTLLSGLAGTSYYWSLSNRYHVELLHQLEIAENKNFIFYGMDQRAALTALSCIRYYILNQSTMNNAAIPYGFQYAGSYQSGDSSYQVYESTGQLPFGYIYDAYLTQEQFESMNAIDRERMMLSAVYLEHEISQDSTCAPAVIGTVGHPVEYTMECDSGTAEIQGNTITTSGKTVLHLRFTGDRQSETYLVLGNMWYEGEFSTMSLKFQAGNGSEDVVKSMEYYAPEHRLYSGRHDFSVCMGYCEEGYTDIFLTLPKKGVYTFDNIQVICQPMEEFQNLLAARREQAMEDICIGRDCISGKVSLSRDGILVFSMPYSEGWEVYVDGKKETLYRANIFFCGTELSAGEHDIRLVYHTPYLRTGAVLSIFGAILLAGTYIVCKRREHRENGGKQC